MKVLAVDIGASTVDLALWRDGQIHAAKLTRKAATPAGDIFDAVGHVERAFNLGPGDISEIRIGSTFAINMLLARKIARVGLITTTGFADTLALARQNRAELYDPVARSLSPEFLVSEGAIEEVPGRLDKDGREIEPISAEEIRKAASALVAQNVETIAVCLLFAHLNPEHELRCAEILASVALGIPIVLSHEADAQAREYERTVSTCLEAALKPSHQLLLNDVEAALRQAGFRGRLSFADSRGHLLSGERAAQSATAHLVGGPAASALAAARVAKGAGHPQVIAIDVGSRTTDMVLVDGFIPVRASHGVVAGVPMRTDMVDVQSIAMGGFSKAIETETGQIDFPEEVAGGEPSLTDALVVLGELDADLAPTALERLEACVAGSGSEPTTLARKIRNAALDRIAAAVLRYAVSRNVDPAATPLVVAGGLGLVLGPAVAERLGTSKLLTGPHPSIAGAVGLLLAQHAHDAEVSLNMSLADLTTDRLEDALETLQRKFPLVADGKLHATLAPDGFMHPVRLRIDAQSPDVTTFRQVLADHRRSQSSPTMKEPGFVFALSRLRLEPLLPVEIAVAEDVQAGSGARNAVRPETLQMRLNAIAQSMQDILFRTAVSPVVREGNDAAAGLLTPDGVLISLSDAIPLLLGALDSCARAILKRFPAPTMQEGDLYLMNDPYLGGTHLPDLTVMRPVFVDGRLVAFAASILHHQDIGGMRAGSVPPDAVDIFQEGLRIAPMRMGANDAITRETADLIHGNSRAPETVLGDLSSQVNAAIRAAAAVTRLVEEIGGDAFESGIADCLGIGEALARQTISTMVPGPFKTTERLDPTPGIADVRIEMTLTCADGRFVADFAGTSPQVAAPINCVRSGPFTATFYSLLSAMGDTMFRNGGAARVIELKLPESSAINASPPAAVNARTGIVRATTSCLLQGLAQAMPNRMPAANSGMSYVLAFSGVRPDGQRFIVTEIIAGGAGGGPEKDGVSGISTDVGNAMNMPAEALESQIPVRLVSSCVRRGSGGAGRFRGGDGIRRTYLALQDGISVSLRGERFTHVPQGAMGGGSPQPAAARVIRADGSVEMLRSRSAPVLNAQDLLVVESCGGAGYGAPERLPS